MSQSRTIIPMSDSSKAIAPEDIAPTPLPDAFLKSDVARGIASFSLPRYGDLPDIELYRDQVIGYVEQALAPLKISNGEAWLTPSMVNNYVKAGLLPAPVKKRYTRDHIAMLLVICLFKQLLPITAIQRLIRIQGLSYPLGVSYDYAATEISHALGDAFDPGSPRPVDSASRVTRESLLVRSAATAFASKAFLLAYLQFTGYEG